MDQHSTIKLCFNYYFSIFYFQQMWQSYEFVKDQSWAFEPQVSYQRLKLKVADFNDFDSIHCFIGLNQCHRYYLLNLNQPLLFGLFLGFQVKAMPSHSKNFSLYVALLQLRGLRNLNFFLLSQDSHCYFRFFIDLLFYLKLFY